MIELKLNPENFSELIKKGISLDLVFLLKMIESGIEISEFCSTPKLMALFHTIERKQLTSSDCKLTLEGREILEFLSKEGESVKLVKKKPSEDNFSKFWKTFPSLDTFEYKGQKFQGSRALKSNKEDCRVKLHAILNEGEYTIDEIIKAVELDVNQKMEASIKEKTNKLKYLQNSLTYLRQRSFEPFIDLVRKGIKPKTNENFNTGGTDI